MTEEDVEAAGEPVGPVDTRQGLGALVRGIVGAALKVPARARGRGGPTALMAAAAAGHEAVVGALLEAGAAPGLADRDGFTALSYAAAAGHRDIVRTLLGAGAEVDPRHDQALSPLILAALEGHVEVVRLLAGAGADLRAVGPLYLTPLHAAVRQGHVAAVGALLEAGADPNAKALGGTPLALALERGRAEVIGVLAGARGGRQRPGRQRPDAVDAGRRPGRPGRRPGPARRRRGRAGRRQRQDERPPAAGPPRGGHRPARRGPAGRPGDRRRPDRRRGGRCGPATARGLTPLLLATLGGHAEVLRIVRQAGASERGGCRIAAPASS